MAHPVFCNLSPSGNVVTTMAELEDISPDELLQLEADAASSPSHSEVSVSSPLRFAQLEGLAFHPPSGTEWHMSDTGSHRLVSAVSERRTRGAQNWTHPKLHPFSCHPPSRLLTSLCGFWGYLLLSFISLFSLCLSLYLYHSASFALSLVYFSCTALYFSFSLLHRRFL